jgi:hypothetical protein
MKKLVFSMLTLVLIMSAVSCGGSESAQVSSEMKSFMDMLTGDGNAVGKALDKFAKESTSREDMDLYGLESPKVVSADENCYEMEAKSGITVRMYQLCWEEGKISKIVDKGFK